jgi:hypothetical protein
MTRGRARPANVTGDAFATRMSGHDGASGTTAVSRPKSRAISRPALVLALLSHNRGAGLARPASAPRRMSDPSLIFVCLAFLVVVLALQGCLLFTAAVNSPPTVEINLPSAPINRDKPVDLTASVSDPDGDPVTLAWSTSPGPCHEPLDPTQRPKQTYASSPGDLAFTYTFAPGDASIVCVWVLATDAQGASALDAKSISSVDRPPVAVIKVLAPTTQTAGGRYPLYSYFHFSAAASSDPDGDPISSPTWSVATFPETAMPVPTLVACTNATPSDLVRCLDVGGFAGDYSITLTVSDGLGMSASATLPFTVDDDHPPCIDGTDPVLAASPLVLAPSEDKTFQIVEILDDGAPFPTPADGAHAAPTFAWQVRRNGGAWQAIVGYETLNALTLPGGSYATGDVVDVMVTISDGVAVHLQPACDPACPAGCPQSATWTVDYR